jgi:starvation-inducible outer membrane lipoprotein
MRVVYLVLCLLAFLSGCVARPIILKQESASVLPPQPDNSPQCAGENWDSCR